ncbi:hypothetical protein GLOIN_2v1844533 [Rhizophagus irregularis DAOM 181602=DAOM 197198]|nr:hypothetical protein GLOIN_2v1844533 [Rhizophagus irregularis DAOM 181602=DAOM 197198]
MKSIRKIKLIDNEIIKFMNENKNERNPYIKASKEIKEFTPKQIRQRWMSKLDPLFCHEKLCEDEKLYIIEWVEEYKNKHPFNGIKWKQLIEDLNNKFGKMRSENMVKNHYYLKGRHKGVLPSKDDVSSQDNNVPKSVPSSPQDNNVSTTVSPSSKDYNNNVQESQVSEMMKIRNLIN